MKKIILFTIVWLSALYSNAQCTVDFTWFVSGNTVQFTNASSGTNNNNWSFGDGGNSYATNPTHTYTNPGTYTACLYSFYTDSMGVYCDDSICYSITVIDTMPNPCNATANFTWSTSGNTVQFANASSGTNNNNWSFGDGGSSYATNPTHTYNSPGTYTACLYSFYTDSMGVYCDDSICYSITVIDTMPNPCNANADFTWSTSGNTVQFTNASSGTNNNNWSFGDGGSSNATNPTHTYTNPGTYTACLYSFYTDSMGVYCDDSICYSITVIDTMPNPCNATANFTWSTSGNTVQFANASSGTNNNNWSFGDGGSSYATNPTHTYTSPGTYTACLYSFYTDSMGVYCDDSICYSITVIDTMPNPCNANADFTWSTSGNTVQFTNASSGTNNNNWSFGDGGSSYTTNPTHTYTNPGTYTACLYSFYTDSMGVYCDDSICYSITVIDTMPNPCNANADFTWSTSGNTVQFANASSGTNNNNWSFGDGGNSYATNPTHTYTNPGTYTACLYSFYTDSMGVYCDDSICYSITVIDTMPNPCNATANFTWSTSGNTVQFTNASSGTNNNNWSFGDGGSSYTTNPTHTYTNPGTYTACLYSFYTDSMGVYCDDSICYSITVIDTMPNPCNANADFTWSTSGNTVQFANASSGTNNNNWSFGDGGSSYVTNPTHIYTNPGTYTACLYSFYTDSMGVYCDDSICYSITVIDTIGTGCSVGANIYSNVNEIVGTNTSTGASFFTWTIMDSGTGAFVGSTTTTDLSYYPNYTGSFWVCLTAHDSSGLVCDTVCDIVTTVFDSLDSTANVAVVTFNEFKLYPNPTNAILNLKFDHLPSNAHARIVDLLGREMIQVDVTSQVTEVQVTDFPSGIYIVQLIDSNNQIIGMRKFVRE